MKQDIQEIKETLNRMESLMERMVDVLERSEKKYNEPFKIITTKK
jgi:RNAse (barnase) inhibitor barstar